MFGLFRMIFRFLFLVFRLMLIEHWEAGSSSHRPRREKGSAQERGWNREMEWEREEAAKRARRAREGGLKATGEGPANLEEIIREISRNRK